MTVIYDTIRDFVGQFLPSTMTNTADIIAAGLGITAFFALLGAICGFVKGLFRW